MWGIWFQHDGGVLVSPRQLLPHPLTVTNAVHSVLKNFPEIWEKLSPMHCRAEKCTVQKKILKICEIFPTRKAKFGEIVRICLFYKSKYCWAKNNNPNRNHSPPHFHYNCLNKVSKCKKYNNLNQYFVTDDMYLDSGCPEASGLGNQTSV